MTSALNVMSFAKQCTSFGGMVHVSTAYVNSNHPGQVQEKIYKQWFSDHPQELYEWILRTDSVPTSLFCTHSSL